MKYTGLWIAIVALALTGCVRQQRVLPNTNRGDNATVKLAEAADSISGSLVELSKIQRVATPAKSEPVRPPLTQAMLSRVSIDWAGPIEPLLKQIAKDAHYRLRILGYKPAVPVLVDISTHDATVGDMLRDLDYQSGHKAQLKVYPHSRIIELRYARA